MDIRTDIDFMYEAYRSLLIRTEQSFDANIKDLEHALYTIESEQSLDYKTSLTHLFLCLYANDIDYKIIPHLM